MAVLGDGSGADASVAAASSQPGILRVPRGLAVDGGQRLYVAEAGAGAVHVVDLGASACAVACWCGRDATPAPAGGRGRQLLRCRRAPARPGRPGPGRGAPGTAPGPPLVRPPGAARLRPRRVATAGAEVLVLWTSTGTGPALVASAGGTVLAQVDGATDLDVTPDGVLVVAAGSGQLFRRFRAGIGGWSEIEPFGARGYDGAAIAVAPDGRVAFTAAGGGSPGPAAPPCATRRPAR